MPLLLIIFGLLAPRLVLLFTWCAGIFTGVWETALWPILGWLVMPYTTLAYGLAFRYGPGLDDRRRKIWPRGAKHGRAR